MTSIQDFSRKLCRFLLMVSTALLFQCLTSFSSIDHLLHCYAWFLILFHSIDEVLLINPSANVFVFGDFNVYHQGWLTCCGTDRPGEFCCNFSISKELTLRWLTFLLGSLSVTVTVLLFWMYFFLLTLVFVLQWFSLHLEILIMLLSQFPVTFQ